MPITIRSENGGEYINDEVDKYLRYKGTEH